MIKFATPLQYSLFLFEGKYADLEKGIEKILAILNQKEDDLRIYPLSAKAKFWQLGRNAMPEGIIWTALPECETI